MYQQNDKIFNVKAEINLKHIGRNLAYLKSCLSSPAKVMAVVKADAYGLGADRVSRYLEDSDSAFQFGVATIQEAVELRKAGIRKPIAVFAAPTELSIPLYYRHNIQPVISGKDQFSLFDHPIDVHIQFNTGMHRFGIAPENLSDIDELLQTHPHIRPVGVCSHFATSADPGNSFVNHQFDLFTSLCKNASFVDENITRHIANTGGTLYYPHTACDMIRPGIGLYGGYPGDHETGKLRQPLTLKSTVIHTHPIKKGEAASYDLTWIAPTDGTIAIIPAGYADGISRKMSNGMKIKIGERFYDQVGRVTMDYILTFIPQNSTTPKVGTEVILLNEDEEINLSRWSKQSETISYEVLTRLNTKRILKSYVEE
jgi:alanine racemase